MTPGVSTKLLSRIAHTSSLKPGGFAIIASASTIYFEITGKRDKIRTTLSDRVYLVLDGEGNFTIDGKTEKVVKDDVIIVPKNTLYGYAATSGTLKRYLVHAPAYDKAREEKFSTYSFV